MLDWIWMLMLGVVEFVICGEMRVLRYKRFPLRDIHRSKYNCDDIGNIASICVFTTSLKLP